MLLPKRVKHRKQHRGRMTVVLCVVTRLPMAISVW